MLYFKTTPPVFKPLSVAGGILQKGTCVSCLGCHNKLPQSWWLQITEMYSLTVLEVKRPKSRCQQLSAEELEEVLRWFFQLPVALGVPWLVAA